MKRMILLTIAITLGFSTVAQKTDAMLFGDVKAADGSTHIPFATIMLKGTSIGTTTDYSGHFKMANLPLGKHTLIAQSLGYKPQEIVVNLERNRAVEVFFTLEDDIFQLEQLVITGTRTTHQVKDVPIRTEVITTKKIASKNACNIFQALEGTPGIRVENQCQSCNFTMVRMQGLGAEHTQILINGQPMYSGLAGVYGLQQMSTSDVDRIEVIKGAGSALYGSSAVAGAINIISKEPSFVPSTTIAMQFGSYGTHQYNIHSSIRNEKGNIGLNVFAQRLSEKPIDHTGPGDTRQEVKVPDGFTDRVGSQLTTAGFGLYLSKLMTKNDKLILRGRIIGEIREGGFLQNDYYKNPFTEGTESIITDRYETEAEYSIKFKKDDELRLTLAYIHHNRNATNDSYLIDYLATHQDSVPDLREMRPYLAKENSITSTISYGFARGRHSFLTGIQIFNDNIHESGMYVNMDESSPYYAQSYRSEAHKTAREAGAFVQDEWKVNDKLMIVPGIRADIHHSGEEYSSDRKILDMDDIPATRLDRTSINPRLALKYKWTDQLTLRFNTGRGYRAPYGFSEDLHLCSGSPRVWKSSELEPETSYSYNLSGDYYGKRLRVSLNIFLTELKDKIGFTSADPEIAALGYDYQWRNIDDAIVQGIELSTIFNLGKHLDLGIDMTLNQGLYKNERSDWVNTPYAGQSKQISRFPQTTANLNLDYQPSTWSYSLTCSYQGKMYIDYYNTDIDLDIGDQSKIKQTDAVMLVNVRVSKTLSYFRLHAGVNNLLNYLQDERHMDDAAFLYAPVYGRIIYAGISVKLTH